MISTPGAFTGPVIVSMTAISSRVALLPGVIRSLLQQTRPPDFVYLNVSAEPKFLDQGIDFLDLPEEIRDLALDDKIRLTFGPNIGPYRKLLPALQRHRHDDCVIVTADDDVLYPPGWLAGLVDAHVATGHLAAYRCRIIVYRDGEISGYKGWQHVNPGVDLDFGDIKPEFQSLFIHPTGRGGVLYRPQFFPDMNLLEDLRVRAPMQDDLGFKMATLLARVPVVVVPASAAGVETTHFPKAGRTETKLHQSNNQTGNNDAIKALFEYVTQRGLFTWSEFATSAPADEAAPRRRRRKRKAAQET